MRNSLIMLLTVVITKTALLWPVPTHSSQFCIDDLASLSDTDNQIRSYFYQDALNHLVDEMAINGKMDLSNHLINQWSLATFNDGETFVKVSFQKNYKNGEKTVLSVTDATEFEKQTYFIQLANKNGINNLKVPVQHPQYSILELSISSDVAALAHFVNKVTAKEIIEAFENTGEQSIESLAQNSDEQQIYSMISKTLKGRPMGLAFLINHKTATVKSVFADKEQALSSEIKQVAKPNKPEPIKNEPAPKNNQNPRMSRIDQFIIIPQVVTHLKNSGVSVAQLKELLENQIADAVQDSIDQNKKWFLALPDSNGAIKITIRRQSSHNNIIHVLDIRYVPGHSIQLAYFSKVAELHHIEASKGTLPSPILGQNRFTIPGYVIAKSKIMFGVSEAEIKEALFKTSSHKLLKASGGDVKAKRFRILAHTKKQDRLAITYVIQDNSVFILSVVGPHKNHLQNLNPVDNESSPAI